MNVIGLAVVATCTLMFFASHLEDYNSTHSTDQQFSQLNNLLGEIPIIKSPDYSSINQAYQSSRTFESQEKQLADFLGYPNGNPDRK